MVMTAKTYYKTKLYLRFQWPILLLSLLLLCFSVTTEAAKIQVGIDRVPVAMNESFQLTFSSSESPDGQPDFSPLKQDFDILNQQQSTQSSWINGKSSHSTKWILTVMAKRSGTLTIPAIHFGNDASSPVQLTVEAKSSTATKKNDDLVLEVEVSSATSFVQEQIIYTVRFYQHIQLAQATLSEPKIEDAVVESLSENSYRTQIKGQQYLVTERNYAIFPQRSGILEIPPVTLTAQIAVNSDPFSRFDNFFNLQNTKTERVSSKAVQINVRPIPANYQDSQWLPVKDLTIEQSWSNKDVKVNVGEPLTRTITLTASGAMASQLPKISFTSPDPAVKLYPDQATDNEQKSAAGITTVHQQKIAFIPSKVGQYTLPAIEIPWFNTHTQKLEIARLPATTLTAIAEAGTSLPAVLPPINTETTSPAKLQNPADKAIAIKQQPAYFWQVLAIVLGLLWIITLFYVLKLRAKRAYSEKPEIISSKTHNENALKEVKESCKKNDPQACQHAFIKWAEHHYNTSKLSEIRSLCSTELQEELRQLQQHLYSNKKEGIWQGERFLHAFLDNIKNQCSDKQDNSKIEPLHRL
jgi:hypothetical protein